MALDTLGIVQSLHRLQIITYLHVCCTGLLIYDYLLTFADEIRYVWNAPWNLGKILFFLTRYPVFVDTSLTLYREPSWIFSFILAMRVSFQRMIIVGIVIAEVIMTIRVWALWGRTRPVGILLSIIAVASVVASAVAFVKFHSSQTFIPMDTISPHIPGCFPESGNNVVFVDFAVLMGYETIILVMTLIKGFQHFRHGSSSFITTFFRDGVMYFAFLLAISFINVVVLLTQPREYANLLTSLQRSLHSMLSARILLHLRQDSEKSRTIPGAPSELGPIGPLEFAHSAGAPDDVDEVVSRPTRPWNLDDGTWFGNGSQAGPRRTHSDDDDTP
ncbi:hypothetical protein HGRIS_009094 [Hohenbuehelia grisea]|uniref:DUF6533 domain-containing protein n=1 Tax=Hohenbuehelia grisea TaxID=104357 RepID=A0ABR3J034_9AGAR